MKFFAVFVALVAAVAADHNTWTLHELSEAIQNPNTDPALLPALEQALNDMMASLYTDKPVDLTGWTLAELSDALQNPETEPALVPHLEDALNTLMTLIAAGVPVVAVGAPIPIMHVTSWTMHDLAAALEDPTTDPALVPYLENALNEMMDALFADHPMEVITIVLPANLVPVAAEPVAEVPVVPSPVVVPAPVDTPAASTSPLVQIIINIQQQA